MNEDQQKVYRLLAVLETIYAHFNWKYKTKESFNPNDELYIDLMKHVLETEYYSEGEASVESTNTTT